MRGLGRLASGCGATRTLLAAGEIRALLHTSTLAGARRALMRAVEASPAVLVLQRRAKRDRRPQTRSRALRCGRAHRSPNCRQRRPCALPWPSHPAYSGDPDPENGHGMTGSSSMMSDMNHMRRRNPMSAHHRHDHTATDAQTRRCQASSANARRDPQITHARATSCLRCTCAHHRWR